MWGGETSSRRWIHWQHHPATLHWLRPDGQVGWMKLLTTAPVDARADERGLRATVHTGLRLLREARIPVGLELSHPPERPLPLEDGAAWSLPGLDVRVGLGGAARAKGASRGPGVVFEPGKAPHTLELRLDLEPIS